MLARLTAVAVMLTATITPVAAQDADPDARFRAAQMRFERELARFRSEYDRYQSVRRLAPSYAQPPYDDRGTLRQGPDGAFDGPFDDRDMPPMDDRPYDSRDADDTPQ